MVGADGEEHTSRGMGMNRQQMIDKLQWNDGGYSGGGFESMMAWAMAEPRSREEDLKSIVAVTGPPDKYTDEELEKLVGVSDRITADYDTRWRIRVGANIWIVDKIDLTAFRSETNPHLTYTWLRKKLTWERGLMHSDTLDEAIKIMEERS
jgi:hypothetical protein